jgi:uncharacterized RDD family membrane protein YckC
MEKDYFADAYSPPASDVNAGTAVSASQAELAERGTRLLAAALDGLLICVPLLPILVVGGYFGFREAMASRAAMQAGATSLPAAGSPEWVFILLGVSALGMFGALGIMIYQWMLISRTGQSLGKKWTNIRIERIDGVPVTFGTGVCLRNWVPKLMGMVPYAGAVFHLVDILYIFRDDRRCIHDHIAGTRVVRHRR